MVPQRFIVLESFALTPSGKIDRAALPRPGQAAPRLQKDYVAPRSAAERRLAAIWEELLDVRPIGVDDDFFALGGHSILGARLMARIQREFGRTLPLATLFGGARVERLARLLAEDTGATRALVPIRPSGALRPFFCVHAGGGNVLAYRTLAAGMSEERPFYAFQALGIDGTAAPLCDVPSMARRYIEEMRAVQAEGPYLLGGWCTGGRIAFEMARQLRSAGQCVELLTLFDALPVPEGLPDGEALDDAALLGTMSPGFAEAARAVAGLDPAERLAEMVEHLRRAAALPPEAGVAEIRRMLVVFRAILQAERSFRLEPYDGRVTLFRAQIQPRELPRDLGWGPWIPHGVEVIDVPGDHLSMFELAENAAHLAQKLEARLGAMTPVELVESVEVE